MLGITYLIYVGLSLGLTVWVGQTLNRNGKVFLNHNYRDAPELVDAISNMLLVGFYLINIGFVSYTLQIKGFGPENWAAVIEFVALKVGLIAIILGGMHFALMFALQRYAVLIRKIMPEQTMANTS